MFPSSSRCERCWTPSAKESLSLHRPSTVRQRIHQCPTSSAPRRSRSATNGKSVTANPHSCTRAIVERCEEHKHRDVPECNTNKITEEAQARTGIQFDV